MRRTQFVLLLCVLGSACFPDAICAQSHSGLTTFSGVAYGFGYPSARNEKKGNRLQSVQANQDSCQISFNRGEAYFNAHNYALSYDTLKSFIETCPTHAKAPYSFGVMEADVQAGGNGLAPQCWIDFKRWLISALKWNTHSPWYFCADVHALAGSLMTKIDTGWVAMNRETNMGLAVIQWIIQNPLCTTPDDQQLYVDSRGSQKATWISTQDTNKVKLDTTLPSMHDLGLDSVLKYAAMLGVHSGNTETVLSSATAYPNPAGEGTVISFGTSREAYVQVDVLDLLGNAVVTNGFGSVLEPGNYSVPISLHGLPSGTYFARILTTYGEAATVKLVKR